LDAQFDTPLADATVCQYAYRSPQKSPAAVEADTLEGASYLLTLLTLDIRRVPSKSPSRSNRKRDHRIVCVENAPFLTPPVHARVLDERINDRAGEFASGESLGTK